MHRAIVAALAIALLVPNLRLYAEPADPGRDDAQRAFLGAALRDGAGERMQGRFPEGYFFTWALYGLASVQAGLDRPELRDEALREARAALGELDSAAGRAPFSAALDPPYGVFHAGWSARLAGGVLLLQPEGRRDPAGVAAFRQRCEALAAAFHHRASPFLPAYPGQAWPVTARSPSPRCGCTMSCSRRATAT